MKMITMVIMLTPYGVFCCLMVKLGATVGLEEIGKVFVYFATVVLASAVPRLCRVPQLVEDELAGLSPRVFSAEDEGATLLVALSTASSGATLPVTLRTVQN